MKMISLIIVAILFSTTVFAQKNNLIAVSKVEFEKARALSAKYVYDKHIKKIKHQIRISGCSTLKDNSSEDNFYELEYLGALDKSLQIKVIRKLLYNGAMYIIVDTRNNNCKMYDFYGQPQILDSVIVNLNESETTDKRNFVDIWQISKGSILNLERVNLPKEVDPIRVRMTSEHKILIMDSKNRYWQIPSLKKI